MPTPLGGLTVTMPAEMVAAIKQAVEDSDYASTSEVIREAVRDWKLRRQIALSDVLALKADLDQGLADLSAGRVKAFNADRIIARGKTLLAARCR